MLIGLLFQQPNDYQTYCSYIHFKTLLPIIYHISNSRIFFFFFFWKFNDSNVRIYYTCSIYGPVQDVRIPYQQKRMFGFVTFVYAETVKLILAKGNPHFVCDSRVLVKPYKEKGKVPDKFRFCYFSVDITYGTFFFYCQNHFPLTPVLFVNDSRSSNISAL